MEEALERGLAGDIVRAAVWGTGLHHPVVLLQGPMDLSPIFDRTLALLSGLLGPRAVPKRAIFPVASIPVTPKGNIDRKALGLISISRVVHSVVARHLDVKLDHNDARGWAELGLDSVAAVAIARELHDWFPFASVPVTAVFEHASCAALASFISNEAASSSVGVSSTTTVESSGVAVGEVWIAGAALRVMDRLRGGMVTSMEELTAALSGSCSAEWRPDAETFDFPFDPVFFGLGATEASGMDPQHALALTLAREALEDAGLVHLDPLRTAVVVGLWNTEHEPPKGSVHEVTAVGGAALAGRLARYLDARGPCVSVDTACSTGLSVLHTAAKWLRSNDCDTVIAVTVNLLMGGKRTEPAARAGFLSSGRAPRYIVRRCELENTKK